MHDVFLRYSHIPRHRAVPKITADGKEGPGDRSGEAYPCIPASPAKMEARHSPHTTLRPHN
ncbi:hypothetical protein [Escherichia coli]|uniref:hypothetical protein n=1 Tax=Escherichia coli TaxID=562 RepID=UPI0030032496